MRGGDPLAFSRLLVASVVFRGCITAAVEGTDGDGDQRAPGDRCVCHEHRHGLRPRFLNGHYIAWPRRRCGAKRVDGTARTADRSDGDCAGDTTDARPPPYVHYVPDNVVFTRMQMAGDRAFVVSPRYKPGVPFTLGYVPLTDCASSAGEEGAATCGRDPGGGYHTVSPYPSLRAHCQFSGRAAESAGRGDPPVLCDTEGLVNVVDAYLGPDGVLWVLDVGVVDTLRRTTADGKPTKYNDPRVLGIDVASGDTVHKITLRTLLAPVRNTNSADERTATLARRLRTVVVEYEHAGEDEPVDGSDESRTKTESRRDSDSGDDGVHSGGAANSSAGSRRRPKVTQRTVARPVAVYVGDATADGCRGSISVWFVEEDRGIRVTLPPSVSAATGPHSTPTDDEDDDLDGDRLHMALLDELDRGPRRRRYLYFTYSRHPDAFRIPVVVFRDRRRRTVDRSELRLSHCGGGGIRCVTNVGAKPTGRSGRPLVPIDSAYGFLWYFRDGATAVAIRELDVLYAWDSRRPFLQENFGPVGNASSSSVVCGGCSCHGRAVSEKKKSYVTGGKGLDDYGEKGHDDHGGKEHDDHGGKKHDDHDKKEHDDHGVKGHGDDVYDDYDDEDSERCDSCDAVNRTKAVRERSRLPRSPLSSGCLQVTSVDHECSTASPVGGDVSLETLWALHTNAWDWLRGRTGRFGSTALLCPVTATYSCTA